MGKYCCFFDPKTSYEEKKLTDICPDCKRSYDFPLRNAPAVIVHNNVQYTVLEAKGRGFYGATYLCEVKKNRFRKEKVLLKVIPTAVYDYFHKDFYSECENHIKVAEKAEHLIDLYDAFEEKVTFGDVSLDCYIEELQFINGVSLQEYIDDDSHTTAKIYAQITIDLLKLWNDLNQKGEFHNDLHLENIMVEELDPKIVLTDAIYDRIRLVAIDLNSVADGSLSDVNGNRIGDRKYIAKHIDMLSEKLRRYNSDKYEMSSETNRLTMAMKKIAEIFYVPAQYSDQPEATELIDMLKNEFASNISYAPWSRTFRLQSLKDKKNAQTLASCFVPKLFIDPDDVWIQKISIHSPQLITGMRGCGKTMLLKAMDIHARLNTKEDARENLKIIQADSFIGIMANCREILRITDIEGEGISKLLLLYSIEILRAARHVRDIDAEKVKKNFHKDVAKALECIFDIHFDDRELISDYSFESYITYFTNYISDFSKEHPMQIPSIPAFELLANTLNSVSDLFYGKAVFFLLDDVSTRYLDLERIEKLLTQLIFMSEKCAFKVTTEVQTISFRSPGNIELSRIERDYEVFDLGTDVYEKTRDPEKAKDFIEQIINKRLDNGVGYENIPRKMVEVLHDNELINIAKYIISHTSAVDRHTTYYGATALAALCVGDIGDVISLYDSIIDSNGGKNFPVDNEKQSEAFQRLCSHRMVSLEGKQTKMARSCVKAFAAASYSDLMNSYSAKAKAGSKLKIRQYNNLHINNITSEKQLEYIRTLIDSGVFVPYDTTGFPRKNQRSIKLAFRKLFGLSNFIPLGNSDRYELSGEAFEKWAEHPTKEVLTKNSGSSSKNSDNTFPNDGINSFVPISEQLKETTGYNKESGQISLFDFVEDINLADDTDNSNCYETQAREGLISSITNRAHIVRENGVLEGEHFDVAIFGMGFEDRTPESMSRIIKHNSFGKIILIKYSQIGHGERIVGMAKEKTNDYEIIECDEIDKILGYIAKNIKLLIDVSGIVKPVIYNVIRHSLIKNNEVTIVHTMAQDYYPLNSDIERLKNQLDINNPTTFSDVMRELTTGEEGEYKICSILKNDNYDPVRPRSLVGFVSPKNQRIFQLLNEMEYDNAMLFVPNGNSFRDVLSFAAGSIAEINYSGVTKKDIDLTDPENVLKNITECYVEMYIDQQSNFDLALTGSKMQAVAAAVFSAIAPITQCWYVSPERFVTDHFTRGVGETICYRVRIEN